MTLGDKIKEILDEYGWSHGKLSEKTGIPRPTITSIVNNKYKKTNLDFLFRIAQALAIPPEELLAAAGYIIHEEKVIYDYKETPEQILESIKLKLWRLEKKLREGEKQ
jgi:transcriptional regulator with XRE-family HTH domain